MLDIPPDPPEGDTGTRGGGGGVLPAPGAGTMGWLLGRGVVGSPPTGRLKDGCSGGLGSDMASLSEGVVNGSLACLMLGRRRAAAPGTARPPGVFLQVSGLRPRPRGARRRACTDVGLDASPAEGHIRRVRIASSRSRGRGRSRRGQSVVSRPGRPSRDDLRSLTRLDTPALYR